MKVKRLLVVAALLLSLGMVSGITVNYSEPFSGTYAANSFSPVGNNFGGVPSGAFWTFSKTTDANCPKFNIPPDSIQDRFGVVGGRLLFVCGNTGGGQQMTLDLNQAAQFSSISFDTSCFNIVTGAEDIHFRIMDSTGTGYVAAWSQIPVGNPATTCAGTRQTVAGESCTAGATALYSVAYGGSGATGTESTVFNLRLDFNWAAKTYNVFVDNVQTAAGVAFCEAPTNHIDKFRIIRPTGNTGGVSFDNWNLTGGGDPPTAPAGVSALVVQAQGVGGSLIEVRWPVSSNDPDQVVGAFAYSVYMNGIKIVNVDPTTVNDGDGFRFNVVNFAAAPAVGSNLVFQVSATNQTTGVEGPLSCSASVFDGTVGDFKSCGSGKGLVPSGITFTTPTDTAAGLRGFCADLMGDSTGSLFLCGLIFVVAAFMAMAGGYAALTGGTGTGPAMAGGFAGLGVMVFNVASEIWSIVWGVALLVLTAGVIVAFLRRFYVGRGGGASGDSD